MMYISQTMTSDVLAISAITIVLLFLHRHRPGSCKTATESVAAMSDNAALASHNDISV